MNKILKDKINVVILIQNLVPYHHARFTAFVKQSGMSLTVVQVCNKDAFSVLQYDAQYPLYKLVTLFPQRERKDLEAGSIQCEFEEHMRGCSYDCVCVSGWGLEISWIAHLWALKALVPVVIFSESTYFDETRRFSSEFVKSILITACAAALVGGTPHADYIQQLGMREQCIFTGHNVVDNEHFRRKRLYHGQFKARVLEE